MHLYELHNEKRRKETDITNTNIINVGNNNYTIYTYYGYIIRYFSSFITYRIYK